MNVVLKAVTGLAGYLAVTGAVYMPFVVSDARKSYKEDCEYLIVLGGLVIGADTPSPHLAERISCAAAYLDENKNCFVVPCGGCFRKEQKVSEARIIADRLIQAGVDENRIILEDKSTTTVQNFKFAFEKIRDHSGRDINDFKIAFLTSDFHIHRATLIARRCGLNNPRRVSCSSDGKLAKQYIREYFSAYELLNPKLNK